MSISRREFMRISRAFGTKAALFAAAGAVTTGGLSQFAVRDAHAAKKAKYRFRHGASVVNPKNEEFLQSQVYEFVKWVEELSDGEINIQLLDKNQACATSALSALGRVIDIELVSAKRRRCGVSLQALDWPFLWRDRTSLLNLLHDPKMNPVYRDVWRNKYGIEFLYTANDPRDIFMGLKFSDREEVRTPDQLKGAKLRITNSTMIENFAASLGMSPVPLAWTETLEGMKSGVVDGMETWGGAAAGFGMTKVTAQALELNFCPGTASVFMSARSMDRMPERLQDVVREAARRASELSEKKMGWQMDHITGNGPNPHRSIHQAQRHDAPCSSHRGGVRRIPRARGSGTQRRDLRRYP